MSVQQRARTRIQPLQGELLTTSDSKKRNHDIVSSIGYEARRFVCFVVTSDTPQPDAAADRFHGVVIVLATATVLFSPIAAVVLIMLSWWYPAVRQARHDQFAADDLSEQLILTVDLCAVAFASGATVGQALDAVGAHVTGELGVAIRRTVEKHRQGATLDDALADLEDSLGDQVNVLTGLLRCAHHDGAPIVAALERLNDRLRVEQRSLLDKRLRSMSVKLVLPLVACTLPGFVLIGVAPMAINALGNLKA